MTPTLPASQGLLVLPHLNIQNANAISSPLTHGFPSMTAFIGFMWALDRKLSKLDVPPLLFDSVGVICHGYQEQVHEGYVKTFCLSRNPVDKDGSTAAIVEEGRMNLDVTLVFGVNGEADAKHNILFADEDERNRIVSLIGDVVSTFRIAGGTVLPSRHGPGRWTRPQLLAWDENNEMRADQFKWLRRRWLPGSALVSRDDLLASRLAQLRSTQAEATLLDAWLDLSRFNWRPTPSPEGAGHDGKAEWKHDRTGWIVPIPVGYTALSALQPAGGVRGARSVQSPFRFVESLYSIGEWIGPHRVDWIDDLLWYPDTDPANGLYRCCNDYPRRASAPTAY